MQDIEIYADYYADLEALQQELQASALVSTAEEAQEEQECD